MLTLKIFNIISA